MPASEPPAVDEAHGADGRPRPAYAGVLAALADRDLAAVARTAEAATAELGVFHGVGDGRHAYAIDPVPRLFGAAEWDALAAGLEQRVRALDAFVADVYGEQTALREGLVPADAVETCPWYERDLLGLPVAPVRIGVAGPDVVRGGDGRLVVLEDNVRTPTMMAYAVAARSVVDRALGPAAPDARPFAGVLRSTLAGVLAAAAPDVEAPRTAILGDGDASAVLWEIDALGGLLGLPVLGLGDLAHARGRLVTRADGRPVDVLLRRTSEERLRDDAGRPNALGEALLGPLRAGTLRVVNAFGTGVADDKRVFPYAEDLVRFFCGEEPLIRSIPTYDLARPQARSEALDRLDELVLKPRTGSGGYGVVVGPRATRSELEAARALVRERPHDFVAQETVVFSTHPTLVDGRLVPRHLDLRPFVCCDGHRVRALPGGLSRFALAEGDLVVNSSQGGGGKDVRVAPAAGG